jgi:hypothetical protein
VHNSGAGEDGAVSQRVMTGYKVIKGHYRGHPKLHVCESEDEEFLDNAYIHRNPHGVEQENS